MQPDPPVLQSFLTEEASTAVKGLLPGWAGGDLAETCSWADQQRFRYRWSSPLHFADTPGDCKFDYASKPLPDSDQTTLFPAILQFQNSECPIRSGRFASGKNISANTARARSIALGIGRHVAVRPHAYVYSIQKQPACAEWLGRNGVQGSDEKCLKDHHKGIYLV